MTADAARVPDLAAALSACCQQVETRCDADARRFVVLFGRAAAEEEAARDLPVRGA